MGFVPVSDLHDVHNKNDDANDSLQLCVSCFLVSVPDILTVVVSGLPSMHR